MCNKIPGKPNRCFYSSTLSKSYKMLLLSKSSFLAQAYLVIQSLTLLFFTTATPITNLTTHPLTLLKTDVGVQCTAAKTWVADGFYRSDCLGIIDYIYNSEAQERESQEYEFTSLGATPKTDLPKIMTPRKYEHLTCVVIVAMLDQFRPQELPGDDFRERYKETDVAMFEGVWSAAVRVDFWCGRYGKAGWVAMGR